MKKVSETREMEKNRNGVQPKIKPDPKWSKISSDKELEDAMNELDIKDKSQVGWKVMFPHETIVVVDCVMVSDNIQKILLRYPSTKIAKSFAYNNGGIDTNDSKESKDNNNNKDCDDTDVYPRSGWYPLPNKDLYPPPAPPPVIAATGSDRMWMRLLEEFDLNSFSECKLNKEQDCLLNGTIMDMKDILANFKFLEVFTVCDDCMRKSTRIVQVLKMMANHVENLRRINNTNFVNMGFRVKMKIEYHGLIGNGDKLKDICNCIQRIVEYRVPIDIEIIETRNRWSKKIDKCFDEIFIPLFYGNKKNMLSGKCLPQWSIVPCNGLNINTFWKKIKQPKINFTYETKHNCKQVVCKFCFKTSECSLMW